ncbi:hypothetical protein C5167_023216 [Papaver somniferum]|uniref:Uncharacterized protein n=1 Tax=Papaver somniferum TaxID=3469 RepID=A0A4Y7JLM3_PAPSO|nr:hypothetical protein C5167_023216 [Papaver somniferum]
MSNEQHSCLLDLLGKECEMQSAGTHAENGRGGVNYLSFEYHGLPYSFCCFCRRLRHHQDECADYLQAQLLVQHERAILYPPEFQPPLLVSEDEMEDSGSDSDIPSATGRFCQSTVYPNRMLLWMYWVAAVNLIGNAS